MPRPDHPADAVDELVGQLERAVMASRRRRRALGREIEGDLREALAHRIATGESEREAAAAVVAEFGDPRELAAELSLELLAERGTRFAALGAVGAVALLIAWFAGMTTLVGLGFRVPAEGGWMLQVSHALDAAGPFVVGTALAGWVVIRRWGSLAAIATVAAMQLAFALVLVGGAIAMAGAVTVPAAGTGVLIALVTATVLMGSALVASSTGVLLRWGALRLEPLRARSR